MLVDRGDCCLFVGTEMDGHSRGERRGGKKGTEDQRNAEQSSLALSVLRAGQPASPVSPSRSADENDSSRAAC